MIGVICETKEEVESLQEEMDDPLIQERAKMTFVTGEVCGREITVVCTNSGKVNNAICAQILFGEMHADALIAFGTARGLADDLQMGDIVLVREAYYFDVDASALGYMPGEVIGIPDSDFESDRRLMSICQSVCEEVLAPGTFREGNSVTGDTIVTDPEEQEQLHIRWTADCADMEGAAIAQVAYLHQKPWLLLRAVSELPESALHSEDVEDLPLPEPAYYEDPLAETEEPLDYLYFRETYIENFMRILRKMLPQIPF